MMTDAERASRIIDRMYNNDPFSQSFGMKRIEEGPGRCTLELTIEERMLNGFGIAHGGIAYSLADSALAFASNAHGRHAVSVETSISHVQPVFEGDVLRTRVTEVSLNHKIGIYHIAVVNQHGIEVAHFKGTVYRKSEAWEEGLTGT